MRKWCAIAAMGVLMALPICAQQKDTSTATAGKSAESTNAIPASDFSIAPASPNLFAMPAPAAKPADVKPAEAKSGEAKSGEAKSGEAKPTNGPISTGGAPLQLNR